MRVFGTVIAINHRRQPLAPDKSHISDAFVIAAGTTQERTPDTYIQRRVRKSNRGLFKGNGSHIPITAPQYTQWCQRYDRVRWQQKGCFSSGPRVTGYFALRTIDGMTLTPSAKASTLTFLESTTTLITERRPGGSSCARSTGVSAA